MKYDSGQGDLANWIVAEPDFQIKYQGKCEAIFCLGNGYIGARSATEESYIGQVRDLFVAGTFNKANENEVTELPNAADMFGVDIFLDEELFSLEAGHYSNYSRSLNLRNGLLNRSFVWERKDGNRFRFDFQRFISFHDLHLMASRISITPLDAAANIRIKSGINGQVTNTGAQHFIEGEKRIFEKEYLQLLQETNQSGITFVHNTYHDFNRSQATLESRFEMDRRKVLMLFEGKIEKGEEVVFDKLSNIYTTRDYNAPELDKIREHSVSALKEQSEKGFEKLLEESSLEWSKYWDNMDIKVDSENSYDQLAARFAMYHLLVMTPKHDNRCGIGAKGLSGEGYKGHSFWDTEIFILPFFIYTFPDIARQLLEYRYNTIAGARAKAKDNGYKGAMYPWESAWKDDGEVTPVWGAADIVTGKATKIWSGFIEQHISSDIAFAIWQYYQVTGDEDFMKKFGYEILLDIGIFWGSRLEWNLRKEVYEINDVVGPDEYKEHVNNDAFTNYMAKWCLENAIEYYVLLKDSDPETFDRLNLLLKLDQEIPLLEERVHKIYIPQPDEEGVIAQDDTYLGLHTIDLSNYKNQSHVGSIFKDYNLEQVNEIQVCKQASVVMLMYLLEHKFSTEVKVANYNYYEPKTLHDSSLSLSTHSVLASDVNKPELSYELFQKAAEIDLGPNMKTSDHGIHAASLGGIWQILVCGFGGIRMVGGKLRIEPKLPKQINSLQFKINWKGNLLEFEINKDRLYITNHSSSDVKLFINNEAMIITDHLAIPLQLKV